MFELKVISRFAAAHQLQMRGKKCENLHGHNWKIEACVCGETLDDTGLLMDFGDIKHHLADTIAQLDHCFLNDLDCFKAAPPSSENIARFIAAGLQDKISAAGLSVARVTAWESEDAGATYYPSKNSFPIA